MHPLSARRRWLWHGSVALAAVASLTAAPAGRAAAVSERTTRTLPLVDGASLALAVTVGDVTISGDAERRDLRIDITREAPTRAQLDQVPIDLVTTAGRGSTLGLEQRADGRDPAIRTDVVIAAPPDLRLDAVTIAEGRLTLRRLRGPVRGTVSRGAISAEDTAGVLRLETGIGPVTVTRARLEAGGLIRLRAFNGDVRLSLRAPLVDTRLLALALNGTIDSPIPLTRKEGWGPRWAETTIGRPDRLVSLDVVTGAIRIDVPSR